ncbi:MAG: cryptochrome/photolyase family protein [Chakrabartia godavariana]
MSTTSILWFRQDLRLHDQAALVAAAGEGAFVPVYILDDETPGDRRMGGAQRWWLHHSLARLKAALPGLVLRRGSGMAELARLSADTGATRIHAIRHYEPWWRAAESEVAAEFDLVLHDGNHLARPEAILTGGGTRYKVFTPWWRALLAQMPPPKPLAIPDLSGCRSGIASDDLDDWNLLPTKPDWSTGFADWTPGEAGARAALKAFLRRLKDYDSARNLPAVAGVSRLSPHLHFGEISPATVWHIAAREAGAAAEPFLREVGWRDYATNLIDQFPDYPLRNGKPAYDRFPWRDGPDADRDFLAWTKGCTGYPIVDAGMRELWATGFMHNRVRMIAASFLIKHLLIDWRRGEQWFWDTLLDADYAANGSNWQWVAGTGVDAPLFSRIMAPLSQSEKFDAGAYIRKWVPELAGLRDPYVHDPDEFGVRPRSYPAKIIAHRAARDRALEAMRFTREEKEQADG